MPQSASASSPSGERQAILRAQGIKKTYQMGQQSLLILKQVDLTLREGEFVAIEGRSGSGKSTLLHIMSGLDAADMGRLEFQGKTYAANPPGVLYPTPFRRLLAIEPKTRMLTYCLISVLIMAIFALLIPQVGAKIAVIVVTALYLGIAWLLRSEKMLLRETVFWILAAMSLITHLLLGSWLIGLVSGIGILILFGVYLVIAGYIAERPVCDLRNTAFGFVFQFYHLLPELNVLENAVMAQMVERSWFGYRRHKAEMTQRATALLGELGMGERLKHKPNQLSGGERQRVAIARALMNNPKVLFADEPTGNLDYETGRQIMGVLEKLHQEKGQTIVMVTHDRSLARQADRVLILRNGKLERPNENEGADKPQVLDYH